MRILYIVYWGALEQLGQSLVVPAVKKLSQMGAELTLVTFEKPADLDRTDEMERIRNLLAEDNIEWIPLKYHKTPRIPATLFDMAQGAATGLRKRLTKKYDIVHGRTYFGGLIGAALAPMIGAKFVFHNEGFYPDEQVDGGFIEKDSRPHRIAKRLENFMYSKADGIIALSRRAEKEIENLPRVKEKKKPVIFVPSCVDLERFKPPESSEQEAVSSESAGEEIKLVYIGSVGGRYILKKVGEFVKTARKQCNVSLKIFNKADQDLARKLMLESGLSDEYWDVEAVPYLEMPERLSRYQAGLFFLAGGISEHGCSPTKIGEYWAVGLPVITTPNVSDTEELIRKYKAGVIVKEHTKEAYLRAFSELTELLEDPELPFRCRKAAEDYYALEPACRRQFDLYHKLITR